MHKWALWMQIDNRLEKAWVKERTGYRAIVNKYLFRLYPKDRYGRERESKSNWVWEMTDLETGEYHAGTAASKEKAKDDIEFWLTQLLW